MSAMSQTEKKRQEIEDGRGRDGEREQAADRPSQKERIVWGCSQGYRAKPESAGGGGQTRKKGREVNASRHSMNEGEKQHVGERKRECKKEVKNQSER